MLSVTDVNVRYGMHEALSSVNLEVSRDEIVVILGANGAGKSTLLSAIAGNCEGEVSGRIALDGEPLLGLDAAKVVEQGIAFVPEGRGVFADLSVEENLQLGSYAEHARRQEDSNLQEVLSLFPKLKERQKQIVRTMSGGEQQMVAIGRALMSAPTILMLDEPSLGLSPLLCKELFSSLKQVRDAGVGILLVEQNAKQSLSIADRGYLLGNGKILGHDSAENLLNDSTVQAAYLGGAMASQGSTPHVSKVAPATANGVSASSAQNHNGMSVSDTAELTITPSGLQSSTQTVSSDSLLTDGIDDLVARASASASQRRESDPSLPLQVVKLTANRSSSVPASSSTTQSRQGHLKPGSVASSIEVPETQDRTVQALLAEFEAAAKKAAGLSEPGEFGQSLHKQIVDKKFEDRQSDATDHQHDDVSSLPHIPVYKKSLVTVYRRDGSGKLRKQD